MVDHPQGQTRLFCVPNRLGLGLPGSLSLYSTDCTENLTLNLYLKLIIIIVCSENTPLNCFVILWNFNSLYSLTLSPLASYDHTRNPGCYVEYFWIQRLKELNKSPRSSKSCVPIPIPNRKLNLFRDFCWRKVSRF